MKAEVVSIMGRINQIKKAYVALLAMAMSCLSFSAFAEQKQTLGEWDVHYMVVSTPFLTPEVAASYGIVRSKFNALVNISVLNKVSGEAQRADVTGTAKNLLGNSRKLTFKKVEEGDAIYYLAVLPFRDQETFRFEIDVQKGSSKQTLKFQQKMYVDE
ncbi:MAG: DUF4426 domain-containing protein [Alteromonas macleodii]|uniref:DUF4426 domain-containing protein n=1 Tax=Alteromonas sp. MmMcT2-5 TaxID=2917733 RepID=UPI001EF2630B|nr:DUF4426 domain-containing protein [Alteromonas sp. MmMcT2-5]MCG7648714.1 DUF4426 domain-containing protein [Alteromonas sp. MmMcT2-5]